MVHVHGLLRKEKSTMKQMKFSEFRRLCFCNSKKLMDKIFIIGGIPHEWVGIGMVELRCEVDPEKHIEVIDD